MLNKAEDFINTGLSPFEMELLEEFPDKYIDRIIGISARYKKNLTELEAALAQYAQYISSQGNASIVTNIRHYEALNNALQAIEKVEEGLINHLSGDLLSIDIREVLYHLGSITGAVTNDELLGNIFSRFCIGK